MGKQGDGPSGGGSSQGPHINGPVVHGHANQQHIHFADSDRLARQFLGEVAAADSASYLRLVSEPRLFDELVASGAFATVATAVGAVLKARLEATTARRKDKLDAETRQLEIAAEERVRSLIAREETKRARLQPQLPPAGEAK